MANNDRQEKLVIYLHAHDLSHPSWAILDVDNQLRQSATHDNAFGMAEIAEDKVVIVIVPGEDILLTNVHLPKMNKNKLMQAIPFALEEQLIGDLDALHFAIAEGETEGKVHVAIVAHSKMQEWLGLLQSWNIKPDKCIPAMLALPYQENKWQIAIDDVALVRIDKFQGFAADVINLPSMLDSAFSEQDTVPKEIDVHRYSQSAHKLQLDLPVTIKDDTHLHTPFIRDLAHHAVLTPAINLLQGVYAVKKSVFPHMNKLWKAATYLLAAWIILLFSYPTISYFILHSRLSSIDEQINAIYMQNFPQAKAIVAPKIRMAEKLQKLSAKVGENHLLSLLAEVGKAMSVSKNVKLKRYDYQNNQLTLEMTAASSEDLSQLTDYLTQQGINAKQQNATILDSHINATLVVE